jgi:hypothetical protein
LLLLVSSNLSGNGVRPKRVRVKEIEKGKRKKEKRKE